MSNKLYPKKVGKNDDWNLFDYDINKSSELSKIYDDMANRLMQLHSHGANFISRKDNNEVFEMAYSLKYIAERIKENYAFDPIILNSLYEKAEQLIQIDNDNLSVAILSEKLNCDQAYSNKIYNMLKKTKSI